jgi:hypothetical protein
MKRITPPARAIPSPNIKSPVSPAEMAMMIIVGGSRDPGEPRAASCSTRAATSVEVTATVVASGPAMAKGIELRHATMAALTVEAMKVAVMP